METDEGGTSPSGGTNSSIDVAALHGAVILPGCLHVDQALSNVEVSTKVSIAILHSAGAIEGPSSGIA